MQGEREARCAPWEGSGMIPESKGGWTPVAPGAIPFADGDPHPAALDESGIREIVKAFVAAARRACQAGFGVIEIHSAHGYLLHEFLSPLSNQLRDSYGGSFENRTRLVCEVVTAVRRVWQSAPLFLRISATDWIDGGWDLAQSVQLAKLVGPLGVDLIDCSSGGIFPGALQSVAAIKSRSPKKFGVRPAFSPARSA